MASEEGLTAEGLQWVRRGGQVGGQVWCVVDDRWMGRTLCGKRWSRETAWECSESQQMAAREKCRNCMRELEVRLVGWAPASEPATADVKGWGVRREREGFWHLVQGGPPPATVCGALVGDGWLVGSLATPEGREMRQICAQCWRGSALSRWIGPDEAAPVRPLAGGEAAARFELVGEVAARFELLRLATTILEAPEVTRSALEGFALTVRDYLHAVDGPRLVDDCARTELLIAGNRLREVSERAARRAPCFLNEGDVDFLSDLGAALVEYFGAKGGGR